MMTVLDSPGEWVVRVRAIDVLLYKPTQLKKTKGRYANFMFLTVGFEYNIAKTNFTAVQTNNTGPVPYKYLLRKNHLPNYIYIDLHLHISF